LGKPHRRKQAVLGRKPGGAGAKTRDQEAAQHRLFQADAALHGENCTAVNRRCWGENQAVLGRKPGAVDQEAVQHWLFQADAALHGEN
jgi:hypothetical protein